MKGWINEWINGWMDELSGWMDVWMEFSVVLVITKTPFSKAL